MLGNQTAGEKVESNMSGKAYNAVQNRLDMQSYIYMNEFEKAIEWEARIWLSKAKDVYVEEGREMKTMDNVGNYDSVKVNKIGLNENGELTEINKISSSNFDIVVKIGAATSTKREATVQAITPIIPLVTDPGDQAVLIGTAIANLEGEGLDNIKEYNRKKMVKLGLEKPNDDDLKEMQALQAQGQQKDPNAIYLESAAQEAEAKAAQARADTMVKLANADKIKADTEKVIAETNLLQQPQQNAQHQQDNVVQLHAQHNTPQPVQQKPQPVNVTVNMPAITINNSDGDKKEAVKVKETKEIEKEKDTIINITMPEMTIKQPDVVVNNTVTTPEIVNNITVENEENEKNEEPIESKESKIDIQYDKKGRIIGATSKEV